MHKGSSKPNLRKKNFTRDRLTMKWIVIKKDRELHDVIEKTILLEADWRLVLISTRLEAYLNGSIQCYF
jgi:hypothetical protein